MCPGSHIDNVKGSDINQSDMGHDNDTSSGTTKFGDSDDIQQVTCEDWHSRGSEPDPGLYACGPRVAVCGS